MAEQATLLQMPSPRAEEHAAYLSRLLLRCLDIDAVWSLGHHSLAREADPRGRDLLLFAQPRTLETLRRSDALHRADLRVLVVLDGDELRNAWGAHPMRGSLARWAWRPATEAVAYYDESTWIEVDGAARTVARMRRKAFRIWSLPLAPR